MPADYVRLSRMLDIQAQTANFDIFLAGTEADLEAPTNALLTFADTENLAFGDDADSMIQYDGTDTLWNLRRAGTGNLRMNAYIEWSAGVAITAGEYAIGRNADGTNLMQMNVPTGASHEWSVNDVAIATLSATVFNFPAAITVSSGANITLSAAAGSDVLIGDDVTILRVDGGTGTVGINRVAVANTTLALADASTVVLHVNADNDSTDPAGGIAFGSSSDTNLFRSAARTLTTSTATAGSSAILEVEHTDGTNTASHAILAATVAVSGGDPHVQFNGSGINWHAGVDASNGGTFSVGGQSTVGTNSYLLMDNRLTTNGIILMRLVNADLDSTLASGAAATQTSLSLMGRTINYTGNAGPVTSTVYGMRMREQFLAGDTATLTINRAVMLEVELWREQANIALVENFGLRIVQSQANSDEQYGIFVSDLTNGTLDFGITVEGADTAALWLGSGADNTDAPNGIFWGSSRDTSLFRSAANTLTTGLATAGATMILEAENSDNTNVASHAALEATVGGTSGGNPQVRLTIPSGTSYYLGSNNASADQFQIGTGSAVGTNTFMSVDARITTAGIQFISWDTLGANPSFASAPAATFLLTRFAGRTIDYTGNTTVTSLQEWVSIERHTLASDTATLTVDKATSLAITAPQEGSNVTLTNTSAIRILDTVGSPTEQYGIFVEALTFGATLNIAISVQNDIVIGAGSRLRSDSSTEIGIQVTNAALTVGSLGSLVIPVNGSTGGGTDALFGTLVGSFGFNSADNVLEVRDGVDTFLSVGVAGYVIQGRVPILENGSGVYHPHQALGDGFVDERRCAVCGEMMIEGQNIMFMANGRVRDNDLHAIFAHPHIEKDSTYMALVDRVAELEAKLESLSG